MDSEAPHEQRAGRRRAAIITAAIGAAFVLIVVVLGASIWSFRRDELASERFDQRRWLAGKSDTECGRGRMARDVQNRLLQGGITKKALRELLGAPDNILSAQTQYVYELGYCNGTDQYSLHAYFSWEGQLQNVEVK
jgi:hypothetical protein